MDGPQSAGYVEEYLRTLGDALPVSDRARRPILTEVADGLHCAVEAHAQRGLDAVDAGRAAVAEFGDPRQLAADFSRQLTVACARRTGLALVLSGPFVGMAWVLASGQGTSVVSNVVSLVAAVPVLALVLVVGVPAAVMASRSSTSAGGATAIVAAVSAIVADALLMGWLLAHASTATGMLFAAAGLSATRAATATARVRRIARLRAAAH
jgi:hypothetical protein